MPSFWGRRQCLHRERGPEDTSEAWQKAGWEEGCGDRQEAADTATTQPKHPDTPSGVGRGEHPPAMTPDSQASVSCLPAVRRRPRPVSPSPCRATGTLPRDTPALRSHPHRHTHPQPGPDPCFEALCARALPRDSELLLKDAMYLLFTSLKHWLMTLRHRETKLASPL